MQRGLQTPDWMSRLKVNEVNNANLNRSIDCIAQELKVNLEENNNIVKSAPSCTNVASKCAPLQQPQDGQDQHWPQTSLTTIPWNTSPKLRSISITHKPVNTSLSMVPPSSSSSGGAASITGRQQIAGPRTSGASQTSSNSNSRAMLPSLENISVGGGTSGSKVVTGEKEIISTSAVSSFKGDVSSGVSTEGGGSTDDDVKGILM